MAPITQIDTKSSLAEVEDVKIKGIVEAREDADYSGAVSKTDPAEIALVRKLDWRIMPTLWAMYFLNYVSCSPFS